MLVTEAPRGSYIYGVDNSAQVFVTRNDVALADLGAGNARRHDGPCAPQKYGNAGNSAARREVRDDQQVSIRVLATKGATTAGATSRRNPTAHGRVLNEPEADCGVTAIVETVCPGNENNVAV